MLKNTLFKALLTCGLLFIVSCVNNNQYDLIIKNGMVYDGSGTKPYEADIGINADSIEVIGDLSSATAKKYVDAEGKAVSPGFINILSWATESLFDDGRSFSNIYQGITLEVFGEGVSMGPRNEEMKKNRNNYNWTTLNEYLEYLTEQGISPNVASFVGATTLRIHEAGYNDRPATDQELQNMKDLVRQAMEEGALGIGSSLIYAPAFYASTEELIELNKVAAEYDGMYISHLRSEGNKLLESIDELITIAEQAGIRAQIYHLKAVGEQNWHKIDLAIAKIDSANNAGLEISADMYTYPAGATGLNAAMPPWVQEGGFNAWRNRLQDPEIRQRVLREMRNPTDDWENYFYSTGPDRMLLVGFRNDELKKYTGKTLTEVAAERGTSPAETVLDLVIEDRSRVETIYTFMSEENVRKKIRQPWMSFETDAASVAPEGKFLESNVHPRAYGTFSRLLGKYVRDEKVITLQEAIRRITTLPASKLKIQKRGTLKEGYFADLVIFDPETIQDHATFSEPHQLSTGIIHLFVNGKQVLENEKHTGETPGRVVYGPGKK